MRPQLIDRAGFPILVRLEGSVFVRLASVLLAIAALGLVACGGGKGAEPTPTPLHPLPTVVGTPTTTSSGLQTIDTAPGSGPEATPGSIVYVTYNEWLADGTFIDTTTVDETVTPLRLVLREGQVLQGFVEGIPGMKVGGKRRLIVPPDLAFGAQGSGNAVPPNATLIFDVELVEVRSP